MLSIRTKIKLMNPGKVANDFPIILINLFELWRRTCFYSVLPNLQWGSIKEMEVLVWGIGFTKLFYNSDVHERGVGCDSYQVVPQGDRLGGHCPCPWPTALWPTLHPWHNGWPTHTRHYLQERQYLMLFKFIKLFYLHRTITTQTYQTLDNNIPPPIKPTVCITYIFNSKKSKQLTVVASPSMLKETLLAQVTLVLPQREILNMWKNLVPDDVKRVLPIMLLALFGYRSIHQCQWRCMNTNSMIY